MLSVKFCIVQVYWGQTSFFGIAEKSRFSKLSIYSEVVQLKPFCSTLNRASTANIQEAMKFYNRSYEVL